MRIIFLVFALLCLNGHAEDSIWGDWHSGGNACDEHDVEVVKNGNSLSIIFNRFSLNLTSAPKSDGNAGMKYCRFQVQFTPPAGMFLAGFSQVYSGGMIKSPKTSAELNIRYRLGPFIGNPKAVRWENGKGINPGDQASAFVQSYNDNYRSVICREKSVYVVDMDLKGLRVGNNEFLNGGLDTLDAQSGTNLSFVPQWQPCKQLGSRSNPSPPAPPRR